MNELEAYSQARSLVNKLGVKSPPVPIDRLAKALGVRIEYTPFDDELSGMAFMRDGKPVIGVNSSHHPNRQRFTIAHELAHVVLHRSKLEATVLIDKGKNFIPRDATSAKGIDPFEMQANAFASEVLMPERLIRQVLAESSRDIQDDDWLISIANRFRVSLAALQYRLARL
ncbi:ImmA/IrrE family metallo-endopeptidase [Bradyrhizobium quebecense]|uniref:ImmA/IrrE family metallo-endopeptidase n=2 Tax=Bradyrhizobium quebecense TaxID=2748629 RepID=A0ACD3VH22_9BRAD|nr:ImmA/IrrE family metallo-endopeptidase [Bradyrhizobium quebecense]UGY05759.1 ImmA/IrrE family metallo-endopeptidase [Bradyrhizobium quebecense]